MQVDQAARLRAQLKGTDSWLVRLAWLLCAVVVLLIAASLGLFFQANIGDHRQLLGATYGLSCTVTGTFIVSSRARNVVGWLLLLAGLLVASGAATFQYAVYGAIARPGSLPQPLLAAWCSTILLPFGTAMLVALLPLVFPNGQFLSPVWRVGAWLVLFFMVLVSGTNAIRPGNIQAAEGLANPFALRLPALLDAWLNVVQTVGILVTVLLCLSSIALRYRRAIGDERLQIKWLGYAMAIWLLTAVVSTIVEQISSSLFVFADTLVFLAFLFIPVSIGIAVLRYRLYDIEFLINRTLVYSVLSALLIGAYVLAVTSLGPVITTQNSPLVGVLATVVIAVAFQPLRVRVQRAINRLLYGDRDEPYAAISRLGQRLEATLAPEAVLPALVQTVAEALRLPYVAIALPGGQGSGFRVQRPEEGETNRQPPAIATDNGQQTANKTQWAIAAEYGTPVSWSAGHPVTLTYQGESVGRLILAPRRGAAFSPADQQLLRELARQAGAAVHAVQLTSALQARMVELRRSRERLVTAQEEERRRIQRDLHDGLGPVLASMRFRLEACLDEAQHNAPSLVADLERLDELVGQATTDIRRLVQNLRPPALDQVGLAGALQQHIARISRETGLRIHFEVDVPVTLPAASEVTIYRAVQEALVNVAKYAQASSVDIRLAALGEALLLSIEDDGVGGAIIGQHAHGGNGLLGMRERAELLGGTLVVHSAPMAGTTLELYLPLRGEDNGSEHTE